MSYQEPGSDLSIQGVTANQGSTVLAGNFGNVSFQGYPTTEAKLKKIAAKIFLTDPSLDRARLITAKGKRSEGTCEWILQNDAFLSWAEGSESVLWISGGPGKGKTILSIFLSQHLQEKLKGTPETCIYYFCSYQDEKRKTAETILRGLIWQLLKLSKAQQFVDQIIPFFEGENQSDSTLSDVEALWRVFDLLVRSSDPRKTFCVLDGLDECDEPSITFLVNKFLGLFHPHKGHRQPPPTYFKMLFISRNIPKLDNFLQIKLDPDHRSKVKCDIEKFISSSTNRLAHITGFRGQFRVRVEETLHKRSEGTFLWVGLAVQQLSEKSTCTEVWETLDSMPQGLDSIFGRLLSLIEPKRRRISQQILQWVAFALKPLSLRELAVAIDLEAKPEIDPEIAIRDAITFCGHLLTVTSDHVLLIHQSVKEYLLRERTDDELSRGEFRFTAVEQSHLALADRCLRYIEENPFFANQNDTRICQVTGMTELISSRQFPFSTYAVKYWPEHARLASDWAEKLLHSHENFFGKDPNLSMALRWILAYDKWYFGFFRSKTFCYLACYFGILPFIRIATKNWCPSSPNYSLQGIGFTEDALKSFRIAAQNGHSEAIILLIERGLDVNAIISDPDLLPRTALIFAAEYGHSESVSALLDRGSEVYVDDQCPAFDRAVLCLRSNVDTLALLLDRMACIDASKVQNCLQFALSKATYYHRINVIPWLVARGADLNGWCRDGLTALHSLIDGSDLEYDTPIFEPVLRLLVGLGANVNARSADGKTALMAAAQHEAYNIMIPVLIANGACLEAEDEDGQTDLQIAVKQKELFAVYALLQCGADTTRFRELDDLCVLAKAWHVPSLELLIQEGHSLESLCEDHLSLAANRGDAQVLSSMLQRPGMPYSKHQISEALESAILGSFNAETAKLLVESGADVTQALVTAVSEEIGEEVLAPLLQYTDIFNRIDRTGDTLLMKAVRISNYELVRLLLQHGADASLEGRHGTAIEQADDPEIKQLLLEWISGTSEESSSTMEL